MSRLTFESRRSMEGVELANLFTIICSGGVEGYSLNGVVSVGHSVMRAMISLFVSEC